MTHRQAPNPDPIIGETKCSLCGETIPLYQGPNGDTYSSLTGCPALDKILTTKRKP